MTYYCGTCCGGCDCVTSYDTDKHKEDGRHLCHYCRNPYHHEECCRQRPEEDDHFPVKYVCFDCRICWKSVPMRRMCEHFGHNGYYNPWEWVTKQDNRDPNVSNPDPESRWWSNRTGGRYNGYCFDLYMKQNMSKEEWAQSKKNCKNCQYNKKLNAHNNTLKGEWDQWKSYPNPKCRKCGKEGIQIGRDFRPPKYKDKKAWKKCERLFYLKTTPQIPRFLEWAVSLENPSLSTIKTMGKDWEKRPFEYCNKFKRWNYDFSGSIDSIKYSMETTHTVGNTRVRWNVLRKYAKVMVLLRYWKMLVAKRKFKNVMNELWTRVL